MLTVGDPAPWFHARSSVNPNFHFDTAAGRYLVLCFFGSSSDPAARRVLSDLEHATDLSNIVNCCFFGVSRDPADEHEARLPTGKPGLIWFWDFDNAIGRLYGVPDSQTPRKDDAAEGDRFASQITYVLDPRLRVVARVPFAPDPARHVPNLVRIVRALPPVSSLAEAHAPVLVVPHIFEPHFCRQLIEIYEADGGYESGFMREVGGKTVPVHDHSHKRRRDCEIKDLQVIQACQMRLKRRLIPEIHKSFQFEATRIERHIVACYDASTGGHFRAHRDNTTKGTAHRRFAISLNLNDDFQGGDLRFAEFGPRTYRAPVGGAVVFSCSLLHEATPVTAGKRYAFLPFLYDDVAAEIRRRNAQFLAPGPN
ncbi:alkyl hydroperoxide reductase/ Thiol specific antioxidant/ Mal allergen [Isosphaera pallida ATCC 43644]|uniref:Alkyl hydroperoxide reductase/ Thiol specific antioxidant/ Mal allergen n=1 Tax=Isosphaera pallida (strain ATCC 43644 / DSM 9630 / IS1B) TaxID=575540 RepID=E8R5D4_ISOPI|nr:2OG-Fe(II) oxygenase [Isosphaera pallida]ADV60675.1 alkyl hydroperoxide reductase/ Thiol specific antioxidant/ Mal allergen [Isosphaera pallida ATCC 43644]